ncbi:hypothetical protein GGI12_005470, partial [Dipsacomyces acuminosporus]
MGNETVPTHHGFLDGCFLHQDAYHGAATLVSFHFVRFVLFTVMFTIAGPAVYRVVAAFFDLERDFKSVADHFDDLTNGLMYSYIVFTLGNYSHTFGWVTSVFYFVGLLGYCVLVELPFMRVSLPGWRDWSKGAWAVNLTGVALVLVAAVFHIRWAYKADILKWYLPLFVLATASVWSTIFIKKLHHHCIDHCPEGLGMERSTRRFALALFMRRSAHEKRKRQAEMQEQQSELRERAERYAAGTITGSPVAQPEQEAGASNGMDDISLGIAEGKACDSAASSERRGNNSTSFLNMPAEPSRPERINTMTHEQKREAIEEKLKNLHYLNVQSGGPLPLHRYQLHLHHWQIFYILA